MVAPANVSPDRVRQQRPLLWLCALAALVASTWSEPARATPNVELDRLTFPTMPEASYYKTHLRRSLQREARQADWGADNGSTIQYRFSVDTLKIERSPGLVRVHCAATGELPRGRTAVSRLSFSGHPSHERRLIREVLSIVARGVLTRLAQIEHARRKAAAKTAGRRITAPRVKALAQPGL
jgi:hypothetical protein